MGLAFALASIRKNTGSVWLCVLFHSLVNSLLGIYEVKGGFYGIGAGSITTAIILILCSYAFIEINNKKKIFH